MLCYHINVGYPVLANGSSYLAPVDHVIWASHEPEYRRQNVGYQRLPDPQPHFHEQVWEHWLAADADGKVPVAVVNKGFNGGEGIGLLVEVNKKEFPCQFEWQNFQQGLYAVGIEPATNHVLGKPFAKERNELIWLEHGEERTYTTRFVVLENRESIDAAERRIRTIAGQPDDDYPTLSGRWEDLGNNARS